MSDAQATKPEKSDPYRATLNLPVTNFAMKANLATKEPQIQERWSAANLYASLQKRESPRGKFVFHDGPPYANGPIHIGHLLNKILKDIVVRSHVMRGYTVDYVPGWDCHGLPIEHKVLKELGAKARELSTIDVRKRCQESAAGFIDIQSKQMQRLGTLANYAHPYKTMDPQFEAATLEVFAVLVERELVYRDLKPVHWSIANRTALADAELEYIDRKDPSIYVMFESQLPEHGAVDLMIWTTTPWTLPANLAVAVHPQGRYGVYAVEVDGKQRKVVVVENLAEKVFGLRGLKAEKLASLSGADLVGTTYKHPFMERTGKVLPADYVTFEDGTGLVHTAPGHGVEDYQTGLKNKLEIYCPVRFDGTYDETVPDWLRGPGLDVWKANPLVVEHLRTSGHLFHFFEFTHSYPHDWRSKTPVIFRATEQWFIGVDKPYVVDGSSATLRERALKATDSTIQFVPDWGKNRMRGMLESRPDWCISRQRAWGLPIPAFVDDEGRVLLTPATVRAVASQVRQNGSDVWWASTPEQLLASYEIDKDPHAPSWAKGAKLNKGGDTFDVWFESGSSWNAVLRTRELGYPAALYLEGSDQHRGWFQTSLLLGLGATGRPPFDGLLTHGFMVDASGDKMSKSSGNALGVDALLKDFGADICRWWVSSVNYTNDIKLALEIFKSAADEYRKVRNTLRFLLANLDGFDPARDRVQLTAADASSIDGWAMQELAKLVDAVNDGYATYQFKKVRESIFNFCNDTLSAVYLAAAKDRLYCEAKKSVKRRRTQTVMFDIADALIRMLAPILAHTADEAYLELIHAPADTKECVHTLLIPESIAWTANPAWDDVMTLRQSVLKALEDAKASGIANPLDAGVQATVSAEAYERLKAFAPEMADLCGVSRFALHSGAETRITVDDLRNEPRCQRSWKRDGTVKERSDGGMLSQRDAEALGLT